MEKIRVGLIGAGQRGKDVYGEYALNHGEKIEFVAVAEPNPIKRAEFSQKHNISPAYQFESWEALLEKEKFCDALVIATPDNTHFEPAKLALEKDYHLLLEKPMSNNPAEIMTLGRIAKERSNIFMICHVLRYTPFFSAIKEIVDSGKIGRVLSIQHNENIGYYHFAHSFVRGNWRNSDLSSPLMLQKSCHDMDILLWILGKDCKSIASFGHLSHFNDENKPAGASDRCISCGVEKDCPYSALKLYYHTIGKWPATVITEIQTKESVEKAVAEGPYGRCVFSCDNNVMDHQSTILEFEDDVTVTFNLSAFTNKVHRTIKVMGTKGEIRADDSLNEVSYQIFARDEKCVMNPKVVAGGHGGGDTGLMNDFIDLIQNQNGEGLTAASKSVQSHMMAFAAEEARMKNKVVEMKAFCSKF